MSAHWTTLVWRCVFCKHEESERAYEEPPMCSKCFSPMVVVRAAADVREST